MKKILIAKLTSLGDILFVMPMISDIRHHFPDAQIDWVVDAQFAELPAMHPAINRVIAVPLRGHKRKSIWQNWHGIQSAIKQLRLEHYDVVLDCHGMIKSALLSQVAKAKLIIGPPDYRLGENAARWAYHRQVVPDANLPAVAWYRSYAALALNYSIETEIDFGLQADECLPSWLPANRPYVMCFHAASKAEKTWPVAQWLAVLQPLEQQGVMAILPWGTEGEYAVAQQLAAGLTLAMVPPKLTIAQIASLIRHADWSIGVDTGMTHLAENMGRATIALYTQTDSASYHPVWNSQAYALGGQGVVPQAKQVLAIMGIAA
ncbi:lipopolysaccharide heptosyltransferase I [uncultured Deefgea sp.]|uniref:lipopolysaccharide heptosyltransferase I n=1 Tax=uncultured Deefgea sp. TaxID=1304914 RepID=UPI00262DF7F1|nr:lipopolysaccharide heptosyltransferase I [uncultured Deefgea sp.]